MPLTRIQGPSLGNVTITSITANASFDNGTLYVDATTDRVGIGNTSPTHKLRVDGVTSLAGNVTVDADLVVTGNLTVSGSTVTVNSENVLIKDNILTLSSNVTGSPVLDAGIEVNRGTSANVTLKWNETSDVWQATIDGTNYGTLLTTLSTTGINASALSTGTVPLGRLASANSSANGVVDTTTQTFAGLKTFSSNVTLSGSRTFLASGSVLDWNSGDVTITHVASDKLAIQGGNVGIGTASPDFTAHVVGAVTGTYTTTTAQVVASVQNLPASLGSGINSSFLRLQASPDGLASNPIAQIGVVGEAYGTNLGAFVVQTRNGSGITERMRIDSGGNVGIGVTPSAWGSSWNALQFGKAGSAAAHVAVNAVRFSSNEYDGTYISTDVATRYEEYEGNHKWYSAASGTAGTAISFTERMRLTNTGNLWVGVPSDSNLSARLTVASASIGGRASIGSASAAGTGAIDTGISVNQADGGACLILVASRNTSDGTATAAAVYIVRFYYNGNNAPTTTYVGGSSDFITFGKSASNTLTLTNAGGGNCTYAWFGNK